MASVLDFITTNPFNESFDDAMDSASDEQNKAAQRAVNEARLQEIISQAPLDTQKKKSDMLRAGADATVAEGSVFDRLAQERNKAGYTEGQMVGQQQENSFKAELHPYNLAEAGANVSYAKNQAATEGQRFITETNRTRGAAAEADVSVGTVEPRIVKSQQEAANTVLSGELINENIAGKRIDNETAYKRQPFLVEDASNQATKSNIEIDTAENARTTAESNKKIAAAKLEQEVFKIGASAGANAARAFAISNGVDLSSEALSSLNNEVYMTTMKGVMEQLDARMPGDVNILARDAALDKISPLVLQASKTNKPVDYAAIEAIISPVTPSVPAIKTGGGGKVWTWPDLMREARLYAESVSKDPIGGVDKAKFDAEYAAKLKELGQYLGKPVEEADAAAPAPAVPVAAPAAAPAAAPPAAPAAPPQQAVEFLKTNATPEMRKYFDLKYGAGAAAKVLGN